MGIINRSHFCLIKPLEQFFIGLATILLLNNSIQGKLRKAMFIETRVMVGTYELMFKTRYELVVKTFLVVHRLIFE